MREIRQHNGGLDSRMITVSSMIRLNAANKRVDAKNGKFVPSSEVNSWHSMIYFASFVSVNKLVFDLL